MSGGGSKFKKRTSDLPIGELLTNYSLTKKCPTKKKRKYLKDPRSERREKKVGGLGGRVGESKGNGKKKKTGWGGREGKGSGATAMKKVEKDQEQTT